MSQKTKQLSKFSKRPTNGPTSSSVPQEPKTSPPAQWYHGTSEMPLYKFFKAATSLNLSHLVISGTPAADDLLIAWGTIYQEFIDGMQDKKAQGKVKLKNEIDRLEYDYRVIQMCIQRLSFGPSEWAIEQLRRRVRVPGQFNPEDQASYYNDLLVVMNQAQTLKHRLTERQAEMKIVYQAVGAKSGPPTMRHFDSLTARVSLFAKFQINRRETMVSEFMELYSEMKRQVDSLREQYEHQKARR